VSRVIQLPVATGAAAVDHSRSAVRTDTVYVVFTSIDETLVAVRVAQPLADAMGVPVTVVHFRTVPFALPVTEPTGVSPVETEAFIARLRAESVDARVRVYLCRDERRTIPYAFRRHSLIVMAGHRHWWGTAAERWRGVLETAGHFVLLVDTALHQEVSRA
jgi:hypothetical protein